MQVKKLRLGQSCLTKGLLLVVGLGLSPKPQCPESVPKMKQFSLRASPHQDTYQSFNDFGRRFQFWDLVQELVGHRFQGLCWPLVKPVDGAAVDEGGELPQASSEDLSNGAAGPGSK